MIRAFVLALALLATPAAAQLYPGPSTTATDPAAQAAAAQALIAAQSALNTATNAATTAASKCDPNAVVPPMEMVGGSAGSGTSCRLSNSVQPRISRSVSFTTDATGQATLTWPTMGAIPQINIQEYIASSSATNIPKCYPVTGTITPTGATVVCYITQSILGLGLVPFAKATAGVTGSVLALPAS